MAFWNIVQGSIKQKIIKQIVYEGLSDRSIKTRMFQLFFVLTESKRTILHPKNRLISVPQTKTLLNKLFSVKWLMWI